MWCLRVSNKVESKQVCLIHINLIDLIGLLTNDSISIDWGTQYVCGWTTGVNVQIPCNLLFANRFRAVFPNPLDHLNYLILSNPVLWMKNDVRALLSTNWGINYEYMSCNTGHCLLSLPFLKTTYIVYVSLPLLWCRMPIDVISKQCTSSHAIMLLTK